MKEESKFIVASIAMQIAMLTKGKAEAQKEVACMNCLMGPYEESDLPILELRMAYCTAHHDGNNAISNTRSAYEKLRIQINEDEKMHGKESQHVFELRMTQQGLKQEHAVLYNEFCELYIQYKATFEEMGGNKEKKLWRHYANLLEVHPKLIDTYKNIEYTTKYY